MNYKLVLNTVIILLLYSVPSTAYQKDKKTKDNEEYNFLRKSYYDNRGNSKELANNIAHKYLLKAKKNNDTLRMADGFYLLSKITEGNISQKYGDSVIALTKDKNNRYFPLLAYQDKATIYYNEYNFKKAFDYYLKVAEEAEKHKNDLFYHQSIRDMVILKAHVGEHETGLEALRKCIVYFSKTKEEKPDDYFITMFALSDSYIQHKKLDSATIINRLGHKYAKILDKDSVWLYNFVLNEGINQYYKTNYKAAKDSLKKSISAISRSDDPIGMANVSMAYFYLGKTLSALGDSKQALIAHKKVDEIYQKNGMAIPQIRGSYDILIEHYKNKGDKDNHLKYIERKLKIDKNLTSDYKYLIKNVVQKYDTPRLLLEKQEIIDSLEKDKKSFTLVNSILILLSIAFLGFWMHNYLKRRNYKKKFNELYNSTNQDKVVTDKVALNQTDYNEIGISEEIIEDILSKLKGFEQNLDFLQSDITTSTLAKSFNTNYKYLSKVVNRHKNKSFSTYINDLRIDYSIIKLKEDQKFRHYTMKAIAQEVGFNTSQAFSKSFYKKNRIHPSYFIKELQKQES